MRRQTPPGRFLAKASATGLWHDVGDGKAREKTSQALQDVSGRRADAAAPRSKEQDGADGEEVVAVLPGADPQTKVK